MTPRPKPRGGLRRAGRCSGRPPRGARRGATRARFRDERAGRCEGPYRAAGGGEGGRPDAARGSRGPHGRDWRRRRRRLPSATPPSRRRRRLSGKGRRAQAERVESGRARKQADERSWRSSAAAVARRARARDAARGGSSPSLAAGVADRIQDRYERFQKGVRAIMQEHRAGTGGGRGHRKAVVADIVQPPPELELAVEAVLGERLGNVIVESHEAGIEAIQFLKRKDRGAILGSFRATLRAPRGQARGEVAVRRHGRDRASRRCPSRPRGSSPPSNHRNGSPTSGPRATACAARCWSSSGMTASTTRSPRTCLGDVLVVENLGERPDALAGDAGPRSRS